MQPKDLVTDPSVNVAILRATTSMKSSSIRCNPLDSKVNTRIGRLELAKIKRNFGLISVLLSKMTIFMLETDSHACYNYST